MFFCPHFSQDLNVGMKSYTGALPFLTLVNISSMWKPAAVKLMSVEITVGVRQREDLSSSLRDAARKQLSTEIDDISQQIAYMERQKLDLLYKRSLLDDSE